MALTPVQQVASQLEEVMVLLHGVVVEHHGVLDDAEREMLVGRMRTSQRMLERITKMLTPGGGK